MEGHMTEPFYGSVSGAPVWTGIPSVGFGFPQTTLPFGGVPIGASVPGFGSPQISTGGLPNPVLIDGPSSTFGFVPQGYGFSGGVMPQPLALGFGQMPSAPGTGVPVFSNPVCTFDSPAFRHEMPLGVTVTPPGLAVATRRP